MAYLRHLPGPQVSNPGKPNNEELMEPPNVIQSDPSALLLSEIEILLAQARLMELYLKQVRAAASTQAAQLHHHYQSESTSLPTELRQKARDLAAIRQEWGEGEERLQGRFQQLMAEISEKQPITDRCESKRGQIDAEIDSLRARIGQLESGNEDSAARAQEAELARDSLRNKVAALSDLLREKSRELEQRQEAARQFERELNDQIRQLERRLAENRTLLEAKDTDLQRANAEIAQLGEHSAVLETSRAEAHANAARELEQVRAGFEVRLAERQVRIGGLEQANQEALAATSELAAVRQNYETEIQELRSQLRRNQEILEENQAAARSLEESRQAEIRELKDRLGQEHGLLETGEHELRNARSHITGLQQQILKLEATAGELQEAAQHQLEQARVGFEAQLTQQRDLLAQKEQALQERAATITEIDRNLRAQIGDLESQLARQQALLTGRDGELAALRSELNAKERSLADQRASLTALEAERRTLSEALEARLAQSRDLVASKDSELERVRSEHAALREQAAQLELLQKQTERLLSAQAEQIRDRVHCELAAVDASLKQKERQLQAEQDSAAESQVRLHGEIERLQTELEEKRLLLEERDHEISDLKEQSRNLPERLAQLESSNQQAQADAAAALERNREVQQAELTALREELRTKAEALAEQQISANGLEAKLLAQITDLQEQLADARRLLNSQEESLNTARMEFNARLEQKDQALGAIQSRAAGLEATLNSKIQELQARLVEEEARANELQRRQEAQRTELQEQLAATQRQLEERQQALDSANAAAGDLQERLARFEASNREAQAVADETGRKREALESALAELRDELQKKESALAERQATIENLAQAHKNEIQTLEAKLAELRRAEAQRIPQPLERRTEKLVRVKAATDSPREFLGRPEKASPAAGGRAQDRESMAVPGQSAVNSLASEQVAPDNRKENALVSGDPKLNASQKERFDNLKDLVEKVQTEESPVFPARVGWGWRNFGRWKRRRKT